MRIFGGLLLLLVLGLNRCACSAAPAHGRNWMPPGFSELHPGMSIKEFLRVKGKANLHALSFGSENSKISDKIPNQAIYERPRRYSRFELIVYGFESYRLSTISWIHQVNSNELRAQSQAFVREALAQYGPPSFLKVVKGEALVNSPGLFWRQGDVLIAASCTPDTIRSMRIRGTIELKMARGRSVTPDAVYELPPVSFLEMRRILQPTQALIRKLLPGYTEPIPIEINKPRKRH